MSDLIYITVTTKPVGIAAAERLQAVVMAVEVDAPPALSLQQLITEAQRRLQEDTDGTD